MDKRDVKKVWLNGLIRETKVENAKKTRFSVLQKLLVTEQREKKRSRSRRSGSPSTKKKNNNI